MNFQNRHLKRVSEIRVSPGFPLKEADFVRKKLFQGARSQKAWYILYSQPCRMEAAGGRKYLSGLENGACRDLDETRDEK